MITTGQIEEHRSTCTSCLVKTYVETVSCELIIELYTGFDGSKNCTVRELYLLRFVI